MAAYLQVPEDGGRDGRDRMGKTGYINMLLTGPGQDDVSVLGRVRGFRMTNYQDGMIAVHVTVMDLHGREGECSILIPPGDHPDTVTTSELGRHESRIP
jgi:hypothetical protein